MERPNTAVIGAMIILAGLWGSGHGSAQSAPDPPDFSSAIRANGQSLASVASDEEALALFSSGLAPSLDLQDAVPLMTTGPRASSDGRKGSPPQEGATDQRSIVEDLRRTILRLTASLAAWRLASSLQETTETGDQTATKQALEQAAKQKDWLKGKDTAPSIGRVLDLNGSLIVIPDTAAVHSEDSPEYARYAAYLDRTYPRLTGAGDSWLMVAEQEGGQGIRRRLAEYWKTEERPAAEGDAFAARYFNTKLRPVLAAHAVAQTVRMEADAQRHAREAWQRLRTWRDRMNELKGLSRLCGTWQWTVHNHTHHQDHKLVMVFPPPSLDGKSASAGPAKVMVLGDTVYLRWESQGAVQEDSLLFAGEDRRLEGTFVNSAGAWGSITGKRVGACPTQKN